MKHTCQVPNHFNKPLSLVCTNPKCQSNRLLCFRCLEHEHQKCLNYILEIEDIYKRSLSDNVNWIRNEDVKQALLLIQKYGQTTPKEQLLKSLEDVIEREFTKLTIYFNEKIQETKRKVLDDIKENLFQDDVCLRDFEDKLKRVYNFDTLLGILDFFQIGEKSLDSISKELTAFFKETNLQEIQNKEVRELATKINALTKNLLEENQKMYGKLKDSVPITLFTDNKYDDLGAADEEWTWDPINKSEEIQLSEDNLVAVKTAYYSGSKRAVIGSVAMCQGSYEWEIDLAGSTPHRPCFVHFAGYNTILGIVESGCADDMENPSLGNIIGFSLGGKPYNMNEANKIANYRERKYKFDLNLDKGTFTISTEGNVVFSETTNLKGKIFFPIAVLYCVHDKVSLQVL